MSEIIDNNSEKYKKFLLGVRCDNENYITVSGADISDEAKDKLSVDENKHLVLFRSFYDLFDALLSGKYLFDDENISKWAVDASVAPSLYTSVDFDILGLSAITENTLSPLYDTIGIVTDFAYQVDDEKLLSHLYSDAVGEFYDSASDVLLWRTEDHLSSSLDYESFLNEIHCIHDLIKSKIHIYDRVTD